MGITTQLQQELHYHSCLLIRASISSVNYSSLLVNPPGISDISLSRQASYGATQTSFRGGNYCSLCERSGRFLAEEHPPHLPPCFLTETMCKILGDRSRFPKEDDFSHLHSAVMSAFNQPRSPRCLPQNAHLCLLRCGKPPNRTVPCASPRVRG